MSGFSTFHTRLRAARKAAGFKHAKHYIDKYNIPRSTYSQHESGTRTPDKEDIKFYSKTLKVNYEWLSEGKGHPISEKSSEKKAIMTEELIDIKNIGDKSKIEEKLFITILEGVSQKQSIKLTSKSMIRDVITIYNQVIENTSSQKAAIKKALMRYK